MTATTLRNENYTNHYMKIRLQGNSIRYRLKEPEVYAFKKNGGISELIQLSSEPAGHLCFRLQVSDCPSLNVHHSGNTITVEVPRLLATDWTDTALVGFNGDVELANNSRLQVLVEKDFRCLDGSDEENEGTYPNPAAQC